MATWWPAAANRLAMAWPIPRLPPVTRTARFVTMSHHAAPGHAGPEAAHENHGAGFQHPASSAAAIAIGMLAPDVLPGVFKHVEGLLHGDAETLGHGFDDANVGLVGKDDVDVLGADPRLASAFSTEPVTARTARLKTSRPSMTIVSPRSQ